MKKIAASVGLVALGATALHAAETSTLNQMQHTKNWSVAATLRGFYDDNISAVAANETDSVGVQISPSAKYGIAGEQTSFNVGYTFTARYFDKQAPGRADKSDYTHTFDADLSHVFSPTMELLASEAFVIGQEPDLLLDPASTQPIDGDNIRNFASIDLNLDVTELLAFSFGYDNAFYDYDDEGALFLGTVVAVPSNSGLFDRMEHGLRLDSRWKLSPQTTGIVGYTFGQTSYSGDEAIAGDLTVAPGTPGGVVLSEFRDSRSHRFYVGGQQIFSPTLSGLLKVGAQFTDYFNDPTGESQWSPYVEGNLTYAYQTKTSFDLGFRYSRTAGNDPGGAGATFVRDSETITGYASVRHALAAKLFASGSATVQQSTYNAPGSVVDDQSFVFFQLGLNLSYQFNQNFAADLGYNYDQLKSDLAGRDYERNRLYAGVTAGF